MKDYIYIPIMVFQIVFQENQFYPLLNKIKDFKTPQGVQITKVVGVIDEFVQNLFEKLEDLNQTPGDDDMLWNSPECLLRVDFDTEESLHFQKMPWFEDQMIQAVKEISGTVGIFYFYHIDDGNTFSYRNAVKIEREEGPLVILDSFNDNLFFFLDAAPLLAHHWYGDNSVRLRDAFPAESAKYFLLFGEHL